ncbi:hypothetical protein M0804_002043 [Polistes exclamans]|nr:hypothetical protein M0804_002043 [Polistes exclamans]
MSLPFRVLSLFVNDVSLIEIRLARIASSRFPTYSLRRYRRAWGQSPVIHLVSQVEEEEEEEEKEKRVRNGKG